MTVKCLTVVQHILRCVHWLIDTPEDEDYYHLSRKPDGSSDQLIFPTCFMKSLDTLVWFSRLNWNFLTIWSCRLLYPWDPPPEPHSRWQEDPRKRFEPPLSLRIVTKIVGKSSSPTPDTFPLPEPPQWVKTNFGSQKTWGPYSHSATSFVREPWRRVGG